MGTRTGQPCTNCTSFYCTVRCTSSYYVHVRTSTCTKLYKLQAKLVQVVQACTSLVHACTACTIVQVLYELVQVQDCTSLYVQACILACTRRIVQVLYKALYNHKQACTTTSKLGEVTRSRRTNVCNKAYVY